MKNLFLSLGFLVAATAAHASDATVWKSVYTNVKKDCIDISVPTDKAEIDFSEVECKSFGGFRFTVYGGDLRYAPRLEFAGAELNLEEPGSFHDLISDNVEWIYRRTMDDTGLGAIEWKGFIYRLSVARTDSDGDDNLLYVVRLDGAKTCTIGTARTNARARQMVYDSKANCK